MTQRRPLPPQRPFPARPPSPRIPAPPLPRRHKRHASRPGHSEHSVINTPGRTGTAELGVGMSSPSWMPSHMHAWMTILGWRVKEVAPRDVDSGRGRLIVLAAVAVHAMRGRPYAPAPGRARQTVPILIPLLNPHAQISTMWARCASTHLASDMSHPWLGPPPSRIAVWNHAEAQAMQVCCRHIEQTCCNAGQGFSPCEPVGDV